MLSNSGSCSIMIGNRGAPKMKEMINYRNSTSSNAQGCNRAC